MLRRRPEQAAAHKENRCLRSIIRCATSYRQAQILERQGIEIDRSTLAFWMGYAGAELKPLWRMMRDELLGSSKLFVDETRAPVLDPGRGRTKTGYFWTLARDDRPWGGTLPPAVVYTYAPGRGHDHAIALLNGFTGVLQTDGYGAYKALSDLERAGGPVTLAHCWAHCRRKFIDIVKGAPAPIAAEALRRIAAFYEIEASIRGTSAEIRVAVRQQKTKPLVESLHLWLQAKLATVSGKSTIAEAIRYALSRWQGLTRFLDDGRIEINSNVVERTMRPIAMLESLCIPSSSVCKHWNCVVVSDATRATFSGHRRFDRLRRQVVGANLVWRAGHNLHRRQHAGFDQAAYRVACDV